MSKLFYHYTSLNVLYNIISNNELWLSNLKNSNDPNEFYLSCEEFNNYINDNLRTNPFQEISAIENDDMVFGNPYGICLTSLEDNLVQWDRYGDLSRGVAIAFDINKINNFLNSIYDFKFTFDAIKYTEDAKIKIIKGMINDLPTCEEIKKFQLPSYSFYYADIYTTVRAMFKKEAFKPEKEYRLYVDPVSVDFNNRELEAFLKNKPIELEEFRQICLKQKRELRLTKDNKKYAMMRNGINSYLSFDLSLLGPSKEACIKKIILGPRCTQNIEELNNFLKTFGFSTTIQKSEIEII